MTNEQEERKKDIDRLYRLVDQLKENVKGFRYLSQCNGRMDWPRRGVYFFFEPGEFRLNTNELRIVRIGTHAVSSGSKTTLWDRLRTHRGHISGGGNHRGSIFRLNVGSALIGKGNYPKSIIETWGIGNSAPRYVRDNEKPLELDVSKYIGKMPFLWVKVEDEPGPGSQRKYIERNTIALLSNITGGVDYPSSSWIGHYCQNQEIRLSGLWNSEHVRETYDPKFLDIFEYFINSMKADCRGERN